MDIGNMGLKVGADGFIRSTGQARERVEHEDVEHRRLAQGWQRSLRVFERLRRQEAGRPVVKLMESKNPALTRGRG